MTDQGPRALIVDDEPEIRAILARLLATRDIASTQACSGEEAMCLFREVHPDLVLLDIKMPGIGGMEALRQMKESDPDIPVVLVTAHAYVPSPFKVDMM
jgi:CheY-like chemotaxis protein